MCMNILEKIANNENLKSKDGSKKKKIEKGSKFLFMNLKK